ncbi:uncharacterized protein N7483_001439 [Penicillium malachiteum]|uniref:uncharacterized protein n=1 Tax=Penicillium malachiteum TaxID=1324776 RepID=UPI0025485D3B|nr:uncharacterized protein N7483_001439 [Penicillium malachiteum]KAJ5736314.1 hypothetical protein N7483_001439 [Penicillium malachiteum]
MSEPRPVKAFGLTQVYAPRGDPTVDIVFVHGLNGHPHDSWTSKSTNCFWPVDLLPEVLASQRPRILTYGYNANVTAFTDGASRDSIVSHAETLASNLAANRNLRDCSDRPIIFVCHSLGGLVVKRALIYCRSLSNERTEHLRSVYVSTFGILFLGTPHNGSDIAKWGLLLHNICTAVLPKKFMEGSPQLVKALRTNNETLQHINSLFADIISRFHIYFFHETRSTDVRGTREIIVDEASAAPYIEGVERMGIEADHSHMCKFDDENSAGYEVVAEALLRYSRQAPTLIADRWVSERTTRTMEMKAKAREIYDGRPSMTTAMPPQVGMLTSSGRLKDPLTHSTPNFNTDHSTPTLPLRPATGRNSPVSDLSNSGALYKSQQELQPFVAPPGFHPNATFFGMQKELEILHNRLFKAKARVDKTMAVLIAGVPGSGKTHLAREYVFAQRGCYPGGVFWIDAKSRESVYKCFWEIAQAVSLVDIKDSEDPTHLKAQSYVNSVRTWLQTRHEWLLIFDGITFDNDADINDFRRFLPWNKMCSIIYTSIDATLRKKQRLFEPYCLSMPRLRVEDACQLLYKDLGIRKPTPEQAHRAKEIAEYYECLPLAIHAIGHRLNATSKPIEKYHVKHQVTDKKLAEPFLSIMNDLYRLQQRQALNLINLLSFLGHQVPVGLLNFGRHAMSAENAEILTSAQIGEDPDLDTTLGTLIHYGLIERISGSDPFFAQSGTAQKSADEFQGNPKPPDLSESLTESSQEGFFSIYRGNLAVDVVKIHTVVQGFCRDELRIRDEENRGVTHKDDPGYFDSWLIVATHFLCKSWEAAKDRITHYHDCGLVRDFREYQTHASRLVELFPKKQGISAHPPVLREARENLRQLMKSLSNEIDRMSPSSSQEYTRNQKSVFDRSSSSSSSFPESSTDEGLSRSSTWALTEAGSPLAESPEELPAHSRFKLDLFPPPPFRKNGYESEEGYETDGEAKEAPKISPALSQMSQATEKPRHSPLSSSPPIQGDNNGDWKVVDRHSQLRSTKRRQQERRRPGGSRRLRGPAAASVKMSTAQGKGSSSRKSVDEGGSFTILASAAERALTAVRQSKNGQAVSENAKLKPRSALLDGGNGNAYGSVIAHRMLEAEPKRPAPIPLRRGAELVGVQMKPSVESLDGYASNAFTSPLSHELAANELTSEPLTRSTYSDPGYGNFTLNPPFHELDLHTAPNSHLNSRRTSLVTFEPVRGISASTSSLPPFGPPLPYDENITVTKSARFNPPLSQNVTGPMFITPAPQTMSPVSHPSAIMPGAMPLSLPSDAPISHFNERPGSGPDALSRASSGYSTQSWATEPVRYPPRFSPMPSYQGQLQIVRSSTPMIQSQTQPQTLSGRASWTGDIPVLKSALQSDLLYPGSQPLNHHRVGSVDERLNTVKPEWDLDMEPVQILQSHRGDVRDPRQRLSGLQIPRQVPYQLYHPNLSGPNLSGPLIQDGGHVYAPAPALEVYGRRARSGSSPSHPTNYDGLGVRFA